jgi:SAM-dependent methyltransferase
VSAVTSTLPYNVQCRQFLVTGFNQNDSLLDVGCGTGDLMSDLKSRGFIVTGMEINPQLVEKCRADGLNVHQGQAEQLPFPDASFDGIVCSVVLPYTDERKSVAEWARVLKPGGTINVTCHGLGYGLNYLMRGQSWKQRFYGFRMHANTVFYRTTGRRLPGFLGDTICESPRRMSRYYRENNLILKEELIVGREAGMSIFFCHRVMKSAT